MKRSANIFCAALLFFACLAHGVLAENPLSKSKRLELFEVKGRVSSITTADPSKGIRPGIVLNGEDGRIYIFLVRSTTTIYSQDWKAITLDKLTKGRQVRVQYFINKEGSSVALSIKPIQ